VLSALIGRRIGHGAPSSIRFLFRLFIEAQLHSSDRAAASQRGSFGMFLAGYSAPLAIFLLISDLDWRNKEVIGVHRSQLGTPKGQILSRSECCFRLADLSGHLTVHCSFP